MIAGKTPLGDLDYQKSARNTVVGELCRYVCFVYRCDFFYKRTFISGRRCGKLFYFQAHLLILGVFKNPCIRD